MVGGTMVFFVAVGRAHHHAAARPRKGEDQLCMATQSKHGCRFTFFELHKKYRCLTKTNTDT